MSRQFYDVPELDKDTLLYLAGLIDGEGCFFINRSKKHESAGGYCYTPEFRLVMTDETVIHYVADKLKRPYRHNIAKKNKNHKDTYGVYMGRIIDVLTLAEQLVPFLIVKRAVVVEMIEFCRSRDENWPANNYKRQYSPHEISLYNKVRQLNQVGILDRIGEIL